MPRSTLVLMLCLAGLFCGLFTARAEMSPAKESRWTPDEASCVAASDSMALLPMPRLTLDEPMGDVFQAGETWYDLQHNGSAGKMIAVDDLGFVHVVWTKGWASNPSVQRHVQYNVWDPTTRMFALGDDGLQIDATNRAGYVCEALLPSGWAFPAFHMMHQIAHCGAAIDYGARTGVFMTTWPRFLYENGQPVSIIWPKIAVGRDSTIHLVATESPPASETMRLFYSRGHPMWDDSGAGLQIRWDSVADSEEFVFVDTTYVLAANIAASKISDRLVITWSRHRTSDPNSDLFLTFDNDLYMMISEDGGHNWGVPVNVTNFALPDTSIPGGDTLAADRDTFRVYADTEPIFDTDDNIHIGFTSILFFPLGGHGPFEEYPWTQQSTVWHWSELYAEFTPIFSDYRFYWADPESTMATVLGPYTRNVQRPSLAVDWTTGYLYCSMQHFEDQWSDQFCRMSDAYVAGSMDNGRTWSVPTNVTRTDGGRGTPPPGSLSERDITLADHVTRENGTGYLHLFWELDRDAGDAVYNDIWTLNPLFYQRIPVDSIPLCPIGNPFWPALHVDSTGFPGRVVLLVLPCDIAGVPPQPGPPTVFRLLPNYPNPFNAVTQIVFELARDQRVSLTVYNVLGQEVARLYDHQPMKAGLHEVPFEASRLPSGLYICRLTADGVSLHRKMILIR